MVLQEVSLLPSPWFFGFSGFVYLPHLMFGLAEIAATLTAHLVADDEAATAGDHYHRHRESHV